VRTRADILLVFVAVYPIVSAAVWIAGGVHFADLREQGEQPELLPGEGPPISVLIPAYNEALDIGNAVRAALRLDYHDFEVLVLDDGSNDDTAERARQAGGGDPRLRVLRDEVNKGKAERLNSGAREARGKYLMVQDADAAVHPLAVRVLVARLETSPRLAAVAGDARVTNRGSVFAALQTLEFAAVIGLIRRTQALTASVGVVAGIIGMFRREALVAVGGYDARMATEDIELTYRLLLGGWETTYEPRGLVGMQVPTSLRALWHQRRRWGPRAGRGAARAWAGARAMGQPAPVAGTGGEPDVPRMDHAVRRRDRHHRCASGGGRFLGGLLPAPCLGSCRRACHGDSISRRARDRTSLRPDCRACDACLPALPGGLLDAQRDLRGHLPAPRGRLRAARAESPMGHGPKASPGDAFAEVPSEPARASTPARPRDGA
jgi:Glycosyltransferase like family 2